MSSKSEYITFTESERVFSRKDLIERQARKEAKAFFDKIREWNAKQKQRFIFTKSFFEMNIKLIVFPQHIFLKKLSS